LEDVLVFECSVVGGVSTVWSGTAFNTCDSTNNEIVLLHSRFSDTSNVWLTFCNDGAVVGQGLYAEQGQYTSQLNVTIDSALIGKSIACSRDDGVNNIMHNNIVGYHNLSHNDLACSNYSDESETGSYQ
jgi:hypothetical protein